MRRSTASLRDAALRHFDPFRRPPSRAAHGIAIVLSQSPMTHFDELSAAEGFRQGDFAAFDWLAAHYLPKAQSTARQLLQSAVDAEDLAHDAFIRAWSYREHLHTGKRFGPWLLQIVRNLAIDLMRRRRCVPHENLRLTHPTTRLDWPDTLANARLLASRIRMAMNGLPLTQRKVALLYLKYGFRHAEIARMTSMSEGTVRSHLSIARKRLRSALSDFAP
jgi:RNA polymerase sigma-70 factor (ECF subfamily)